jgi:murein DD-endopeptidase MepM/ murein hydrolase activator NlpD
MGFNGHMGLDYAGPQPGALIPVYAAHAGVVVVAGEESGWGNHIRIQGDGFQTNYAHLSKIWVKEGETVKAMQEIGIIGNTGTSTAVHLHF